MDASAYSALWHKRIMRAADASFTLFMPWQRLSKQIALSSSVVEARLDHLTTLMDEDMTLGRALKRLGTAQDEGPFFSPVRSIVRSAAIAGFNDGSHYRGRLPRAGFVDIATRKAEARAAVVDQQMRMATKAALRSNPDNKFMFSAGRALRAVRFEAANAYNDGLLTALTGFNVRKEWVTTSVAPCEEICLENEDAGLIPLGDDFPSGDPAPLGHLQCGCVLGIT